MTYKERMEAYTKEAKRLSHEDNTEKLKEAVRLIMDSERLIIGGAAGLSAAGGMDFMSEKSLKKNFPALSDMGYKTLWQALWDPNRSECQKWGMHAAEIIWARFDYPVIKAYTDLLSIIEGKDYFVLTSNIDDQFYKAGFDPERVFAPQDSMAHFQCSVPCCDDIWYGEDIYRRIYENMDKKTFTCRPEDLPRCPHCGAPAINNLRDFKPFIPKMVMKNKESFTRYFNEAASHRTVFLELGVGFNSPGLIRHPFQRFTWLYPNAHLIRMNMEYPSVPDKIKDKSIEIGGDLGLALEKMAAVRNDMT